MKREQIYAMDQDAEKDILWWTLFLPRFNGTAKVWMDEQQEPDQVMATDSCMEGFGGCKSKKMFHVDFPREITNRVGTSIAVLEMWAIIIALKLWGHELQGQRIWIYCDNQAVVNVLERGRTRDPWLQAGTRETCWLQAVNRMELKTKFIRGQNNQIPDFLSRVKEKIVPRNTKRGNSI